MCQRPPAFVLYVEDIGCTCPKLFFFFQKVFIQYVSCQKSNAVDNRVQLVTQYTENG